jgi:hypothetical protein
MLVQPADDIDRVLCFFSSRILFSIASSEDAIFSEVSFDGLYLGRDTRLTVHTIFKTWGYRVSLLV